MVGLLVILNIVKDLICHAGRHYLAIVELCNRFDSRLFKRLRLNTLFGECPHSDDYLVLDSRIISRLCFRRVSRRGPGEANCNEYIIRDKL
jgi:hypothetical protein